MRGVKIQCNILFSLQHKQKSTSNLNVASIISMSRCLCKMIKATLARVIIRARKVGGLWRHEFAICGYKLTIHFHIWWFCNVTDRLLFVSGYYTFHTNSGPVIIPYKVINGLFTTLYGIITGSLSSAMCSIGRTSGIMSVRKVIYS